MFMILAVGLNHRKVTGLESCSCSADMVVVFEGFVERIAKFTMMDSDHTSIFGFAVEAICAIE